MGSYWNRFGIVSGTSWVLFLIVLGPFCDRLQPCRKWCGTVLGSFWDRFGIVLGSFWNRFGFVLGSFWHRFGVVLGSCWGRVGVVLGQSCNSKIIISAVNPVTAVTKITQKVIIPAL